MGVVKIFNHLTPVDTVLAESFLFGWLALGARWTVLWTCTRRQVSDLPLMPIFQHLLDDRESCLTHHLDGFMSAYKIVFVCHVWVLFMALFHYL